MKMKMTHIICMCVGLVEGNSSLMWCVCHDIRWMGNQGLPKVLNILQPSLTSKHDLTKPNNVPSHFVPLCVNCKKFSYILPTSAFVSSNWYYRLFQLSTNHPKLNITFSTTFNSFQTFSLTYTCNNDDIKT